MKLKIIDKTLGIDLNTKEGLKLKIGAYKTIDQDLIEEHAVIYKGKILNPKEPVLLRINSACYTGDIFHCSRCDCTWQLYSAIKMIEENEGLLIYHFSHEGRGIGFLNKLKTYHLMDQNKMTTHDAFLHTGHSAEERNFSAASSILHDLGIHTVRLITNNPDKQKTLEENGIDVVERVPLVNNDEKLRSYLLSKKEQFGHIINFLNEAKV